MFKKLKEKIESEGNQSSTGVSRRSRNSVDDTAVNSSEDNTNDNQSTISDDDSVESSCKTSNDDIAMMVTCDTITTASTHNTGSIIDDSVNDQLNQLKRDLLALRDANASLESQLNDRNTDLNILKNQLNLRHEENMQLRDQLSQYHAISDERDDLLVRNAQLSSELEKLRQEFELRLNSESNQRLDATTSKKSENSDTISTLNDTIVKLEESLADKNKTIKLQQQRLSDIKKTFQRDLYSQSAKDDTIDEQHQHLTPKPSVTAAINNELTPINVTNDSLNGREINFTYLRNVIFKYMVSSEYESVHLVKAIAVLLEFTKDEEKLIKETLEWKMSWFASLIASKPSLTNKK